MIKANESANRLFGDHFNIEGKNVLDLFHESEADIIIQRIGNSLSTMRYSFRTNTYLTNPEITEPFYLQIKSKVIMWQGQKAIFGLGTKLDMPVQIPLKFNAGD